MPQTTATTNTPRAKRRSRQWWFEQVQVWRSSGLSKVEYCVANGLKPAALYHWASRLRYRADAPIRAPEQITLRSTFVQAIAQPDYPVPTAHALTVRDVTVQFDAGLAPAALTEWVQVLRARPC